MKNLIGGIFIFLYFYILSYLCVGFPCHIVTLECKNVIMCYSELFNIRSVTLHLSVKKLHLKLKVITLALVLCILYIQLN